MLKRDILLAQEYLGFLLLNVFDLFLTGYIFRNHGAEANGLAVLVMKQFGLVGFAIYKFLLVLVVVLACEGISMKSVRTARLVVTGGCTVYVLIVLWECYLIFTHITGPASGIVS